VGLPTKDAIEERQTFHKIVFFVILKSYLIKPMENEHWQRARFEATKKEVEDARKDQKEAKKNIKFLHPIKTVKGIVAYNSAKEREREAAGFNRHTKNTARYEAEDFNDFLVWLNSNLEQFENWIVEEFGSIPAWKESVLKYREEGDNDEPANVDSDSISFIKSNPNKIQYWMQKKYGSISGLAPLTSNVERSYHPKRRGSSSLGSRGGAEAGDGYHPGPDVGDIIDRGEY
jgi:hypothetical protein